MPQSPYDSLHKCTVRVVVEKPEGETWGTGFFIARGWVLTCAHVVVAGDGRAADCIRIISEDGSTADVTIESEHLYAGDYPDLALLRLDLGRYPEYQDHPVVTLHPAVKPHDEVYTYGYGETKTRRPGASMTAEVEGWAQSGGSALVAGKLVQLKQGQVVAGLSGAPLLNLKTGGVCGVVKATRDNYTDLGGWAIPATVVLELYGKVLGKGADGEQHHTETAPRSERPDFIPKLYDREAPEQDFAAWLSDQLGPRPCTRAYFVFGEKHEQHSTFAERVRNVSLPFYVNGRFKQSQAAIGDIPEVHWPGGEVFSEHLKNKVRASLAYSASVNSEFTCGWDLLPHWHGYRLYPVVFITHAIRIEKWTRAQRDLLAWYLDVFWDDAARKGEQPYVVLLLLFECSEAMAVRRPRDWLLFWRGSAKDRLRRDLLALQRGTRHGGFLGRLRFWRAGADAPVPTRTRPARGCSRVLLTELTPLDVDDITTWYAKYLAKRARLTRYQCREKATAIYDQADRRRDSLPCTDHIESLLQEAYEKEPGYAGAFDFDS